MLPEVIDSLNKIILAVHSAWEFFLAWWWLPLPFILWKPFSFLWLWWRTDGFLKKIKMVLIEVKIPKEVLKPIRAMEVVIDHLWQVMYDGPDWWEKWVEGKVILSYYFEFASIGGESHFFIRIPETARDSVEAAVYSQYSEAEISVVEDYTKDVPQNIPNKDWDLWGCDYRLLAPNPYPIKTYVDFETEHEAKEEKRIDPLAQLLEIGAKINPGEQLWIQIGASPVTNKEYPWVDEGKKIRDEVSRRTKKAKPGRPIILDAIDVLATGNPPKEPTEEKEIIPPEMKLTPGERDILTAIEKKLSKRGYNCHIRFIYLGNKDVFYKPKLRLPLGFFSAFSTQNLNNLVPKGQPFITKIAKTWFLPMNMNFILDRRLYSRKRTLFRKYKNRDNPYFPLPAKWPSCFILNSEELASIFHFPGKLSAPAPFIERIESKKGEAPPGLPTE